MTGCREIGKELNGGSSVKHVLNHLRGTGQVKYI